MKRRRSHPFNASPEERSRRRSHDSRKAGRRSSGADGAGAAGAAHALLLRGREAEDAGDLEGALVFYAEATTRRGAASDPAGLATLFQRMANCSSLLGDEEAAWERYLAAARLFHTRGVAVELGASLGEAGMVLVGFSPPPPEAMQARVTHALLLGGVADAVDHAVDALLGADLPPVGVAVQVHRKLTGLMVLATCAAASHPLETGAAKIYSRVVLPFRERHSIGPETPTGDAKAFADMFMALALLWSAIAEQEGPDREGIPPTSDEVEALRSHASLAFPGTRRASMLLWLDSYLRDRRGADMTAADHPATAAGEG